MTSSQLLLEFTVDLKDNFITILSAYNDKLLVSHYDLSQLLVYSQEGRHLFTITTHDNEALWDATWTPRGKIAYTTSNSNKVVVMPQYGGAKVTTHINMTKPQRFSVSNDIIYLSDVIAVYQSADDGLSWSLVFTLNDGWHCWQAIKVTTEYSDDFWTLVNNHKSKLLVVYSMDRRSFDGNVTWKEINITRKNGKNMELTWFNTLSYDGKKNIFLNDDDKKAVHMYSVSGQYCCQLLSSHNFANEPYVLKVDQERQLMYVGQDKNVVGVFKLTYGK